MYVHGQPTCVRVSRCHHAVYTSSITLLASDSALLIPLPCWVLVIAIRSNKDVGPLDCPTGVGGGRHEAHIVRAQGK